MQIDIEQIPTPAELVDYLCDFSRIPMSKRFNITEIRNENEYYQVLREADHLIECSYLWTDELDRYVEHLLELVRSYEQA